jgi:hypothetical protein
LAPTWSLFGALLVAVLVGSTSLHLVAPSTGMAGQLGDEQDKKPQHYHWAIR